MRGALALLALLPLPAGAEALVTTHTLRAATVITEADVTLVEAEIPGAVTRLEDALGQEVRETIYAGRPVGTDNIGPPALVQRNQLVSLIYQQGPLAIIAEGRALARGGAGEWIKVMNTASHTTVQGVIGADGMVRVSLKQE